jgi:hypothetical protein
LDDGAVSKRVAVREADFDEAGAVFGEFADQKRRGVQVWVAGRKKRDERFLALERRAETRRRWDS